MSNPTPDERQHEPAAAPLPEANISTLAHELAARRATGFLAPDLTSFGHLEEIAHGGIGVVYRGRDPNLDRDLAIKVLRPDRADQPDLVRRFIEEAKIGGQLQHPGVPPVHSLGRMPDGRPYFTMKLIRGRTLADLLANRAQSTDDWPRFLQIFEQICQTLAYAHSQGIIHRDLKPANVMVGAFGEVQVMDWGFAKVLRHEQPEPTGQADYPKLATDPSEEQSQAGQIMGTLPYMAPEQARGEVDRLDPRSDVFSLGAILCKILTGKPPYHGPQLSILGQAQHGDLAEAWQRLERSGADGDLIALARQCLNPIQEERPRDAGVLAAALAAYHAGVQERLRGAELARAAAQAKDGEERKRRRLAVALAAAMVGLILAGGGFLWWRERVETRLQVEVDRQNARDERAEQAMASAVKQSVPLLEAAKWAELEAVLAQADSRLAEEAATELRQRLRQIRGNFNFVKELDGIHLAKGIIVNNQMNEAGAAMAYEKAFRNFGLDILNGNSAAMARQIEASPIKVQLMMALDDWAGIDVAGKVPQPLLEITGQVNRPEKEWLISIRRAEASKDLGKLKKLGGQTDVVHFSPILLEQLGRKLEKLGGDGLSLLERAHQQHPGNFYLNYTLGNTISRKHKFRLDEAIGYYRAALSARPDSSAVYNNLAVVFVNKNDTLGAIAALKKGIALDPNNTLLRLNRGVILSDLNDLEGGIESYQQAIALDPNHATAFFNLGICLLAKGDVKGAIAAYENAIAKSDREKTSDMDLDRKRSFLPMAYTNLGIALKANNDLDGAIASYQKAIALNPEFAMAHFNLAVALGEKGDLAGSIAAYQQAITLDSKDAKAHYNLALALRAKNDLEGSIAAYRKAAAIDPQEPKSWYNLGNSLVENKDLDGAAAAFRKAIALNPKDRDAHFNLGMTLRVKGDLEGALAALRNAIAIDPNHARSYAALGHCLLQRGRFQGCRAATLKALALLLPVDPDRSSMEEQLRKCEQLLTRDKKVAAVLNGNAAEMSFGEPFDLADFCRQYHRNNAAAQLYASAFDQKPKLAADLDAQHRYHAACAAALAAAGKGEDVAKLRGEDKARLRLLARTWLHADLNLYIQRVKEENLAVLLVADRLAHWQKDPDLASLRESEELNKLSDQERAHWHKLWDQVQILFLQARQRLTDTKHAGVLTSKKKTKLHSLEMTAGTTYVLDLESNAFDTYLILEDGDGNEVAENDDIDSDHLDSRIIFTPQKSGPYRVIVTSFQQSGTGPYVLRIRSVAGAN